MTTRESGRDGRAALRAPRPARGGRTPPRPRPPAGARRAPPPPTPRPDTARLRRGARPEPPASRAPSGHAARPAPRSARPRTAASLRTIEACDRGRAASARGPPAVARLPALRAQPPLRDLRHRRARLALPRGPHAAALHELRLRRGLRPDRAPHVPDGRGRGRDPRRRQLRLHPLLLPGQGARVPAPAHPHRLLGADGVFDARAGPLRHLRVGDRAPAERELPPRRASPGQRHEPRHRHRRPALGERQLRPDDEPVPRRAAVGRLLDRDAPEHRHHRPAHGDPRRRLQAWPTRDHRRQPQRHAGRVHRAARLPPRAARPPVRPAPSAER